MKRGLVLTIAVGFLAPALLLAGALVASQDVSVLESQAQPSPLVVPVTEGTQRLAFGVKLSVTQADPALVAAPVGGVVTSVDVAEGATLDTGDPIGSIDDQRVVALVQPVPLWRDIGPGAAGPDVARAQRLLTQLGLYEGQADGRVGGGTADAIKSFNERFGLTPGATLRASSLAWVGDAPFDVSTLSIELGTTIAAGEPLVVGPEPDPLVTVAEPSAPTVEIRDGTPYELVLQDVVVDYIPGSLHVEDGGQVRALSEVMALIGVDTDVAATVQLATPIPVAKVPASAVITDPVGQFCVFPDASAAPVRVTPVGGGLAEVHLPADIGLDHVLANPRDVRDATTCAS